MNPPNTIDNAHNYIIIAGKLFKIVSLQDTCNCKGKAYLQFVSLPGHFYFEFQAGQIKLDIALQYPQKISFKNDWIAWGIGCFFPPFQNFRLKTSGACLEMHERDLASQAKDLDLKPLVDYISNNNKSFYARRTNKAFEALSKKNEPPSTNPMTTYQDVIPDEIRHINADIFESILSFLELGGNRGQSAQSSR